MRFMKVAMAIAAVCATMLAMTGIVRSRRMRNQRRGFRKYRHS
jgi:hypothetical protein